VMVVSLNMLTASPGPCHVEIRNEFRWIRSCPHFLLTIGRRED